MERKLIPRDNTLRYKQNIIISFVYIFLTFSLHKEPLIYENMQTHDMHIPPKHGWTCTSGMLEMLESLALLEIQLSKMVGMINSLKNRLGCYKTKEE